MFKDSITCYAWPCWRCQCQAGKHCTGHGRRLWVRCQLTLDLSPLQHKPKNIPVTRRRMCLVRNWLWLPIRYRLPIRFRVQPWFPDDSNKIAWRSTVLPDYKVWHSTTKYNSLIERTTPYYKVVHRTTKYYFALLRAAKYRSIVLLHTKLHFSLLQSTKKYKCNRTSVPYIARSNK